MAIDRFTVAAAAACLVALAAGCRSMLEVPESARANGWTSQDDQREGWLFDRLTGRNPAAGQSEPSPDRRQPDSEAHLASHSSGTESAAAAGAAGARPEIEPDQEQEGLSLGDFAPSKIKDTVKKLTGNGPNEEVARALYQEGDVLFKEGKYEEAAERFKQAAGRAPESPLQEDCLFMRAESLFFCDQYPKANEAYAELLKKYEYSRYLDTAVARQFAIGRYWEQLNAARPAWLLSFQVTDPTRPKFDTFGHALKAYQSVRMNDPTGPLADDSIMATGNAYFLKGRYEEAAHNYDLIRKEYPKSEHQLNAHLLGLQSKLQMYQGPKYDGSPLEEAGEIAEQTVRQFRSQLGPELERVVRAQNAIVEQKAEREWRMGQYYDRKKQYRAARLYYQFLLEEYPTTAAAEQARRRLAEIRDLPDKPTNHFQWLTDVFPSTSD